MPASLAASTTKVPSGTVTLTLSMVSATVFTIMLSLHPIHPCLRSPDCEGEILGEPFEGRADRHGGEIAQSAQAFPINLSGNSLEQLQIHRRTMTFMDPFDDVQHPISAIPAGSAFTAGFV